MKMLIVAAVVTLVAGCAGMGMRTSGGGGGGTGVDRSQASGNAAYDEQERIFNSWTN